MRTSGTLSIVLLHERRLQNREHGLVMIWVRRRRAATHHGWYGRGMGGGGLGSERVMEGRMRGDTLWSLAMVEIVGLSRLAVGRRKVRPGRKRSRAKVGRRGRMRRLARIHYRTGRSRRPTRMAETRSSSICGLERCSSSRLRLFNCTSVMALVSSERCTPCEGLLAVRIGTFIRPFSTMNPTMPRQRR